MSDAGRGEEGEGGEEKRIGVLKCGTADQVHASGVIHNNCGALCASGVSSSRASSTWRASITTATGSASPSASRTTSGPKACRNGFRTASSLVWNTDLTVCSAFSCS